MRLNLQKLLEHALLGMGIGAGLGITDPRQIIEKEPYYGPDEDWSAWSD